MGIRWILPPTPSLTSHWFPQNWLGGFCHLNIILVGPESPLLVFLSCVKPHLLKLRSTSLMDGFYFPVVFLYSFIRLKTSSGLRPCSGQMLYLLTPQHALNVSSMADVVAGTGTWS